MPRKKVGQPLKHIVHNNDGKIIDGLKYDIKNDTYYAYYKDEQGKNKKKNFGRDKEKAIEKFGQWQNQDDIEDINVGLKIQIGNQWDFFKNKLLNDGAYAAKMLDMPCFADPNFLKNYKPKPSYTLKEIGDNYFNKVELQNLKGQPQLEFKKVKKTWERFCNVVGVKTIADLTKEKFKIYYEDLYSEYERKKLSTTWLRGFLERVIRVLNSAIKDFDNSSDIVDAKGKCSAVFS